jgi:arabinose-5-phosphate isomerase
MTSRSDTDTGKPDAFEQLQRVLAIESDAIRQMADGLNARHLDALDLLYATQGRLIVTGVGKSGHVGHKIAATFASTGTPAQFVHPTEASHGDMGMITRQDLCLAISNSGETTELSDLITYTRRFGIPLIAITKSDDSTLGRAADVTLTLPDAPEACLIGIAPTTSTTVTLALGDALAVALMHRRGFRREDFQIFHPGGKLGAQLTRVEALMHSGDAVPVVPPDTIMSEALIEMTTKGFGITGVVEDERLVGVITDGDLRRHLDDLLDKRAIDVATRPPKTVPPETLASEALKLMNDVKINALFVTNPAQNVLGVLRIHDCLRAGVA